jgi:hypothetical protein
MTTERWQSSSEELQSSANSFKIVGVIGNSFLVVKG